jgi:hypothetical protein
MLNSQESTKNVCLQASNIWKEWTSLQILINNSRLGPFGLAPWLILNAVEEAHISI